MRLLAAVDQGTAELLLGVTGVIAMALAAAWGRSVLSKLDSIADAVNNLGNKVAAHDVEIDNLKDHVRRNHLHEETP